MERPTDLIQSVSRALRILEAVGEAPQGLPPKVIARRCGFALATTYHLVRTLAYEGYLARLGNGDYVVGLEIADRFRDLMAALEQRPGGSAVLRHVAETTGHSAYLARFVQGRVTITQVVEAPHSPPLEDLIPGFDEGAHATALGKALLSTLPARARRDYLADAGLRSFTPHTVRDPDALEAELARAAGNVYAEECQFRDGVSCAAVLVPEAAGACALAVSAAAADFAAKRVHLVGALRLAAGDLAA